MNCPECGKEVRLMAEELKTERISMTIKYEGDLLEAKTVGGIITNVDKLLKEVSKSHNRRIYVGFGGFEQKEKELTVHLLVMEHQARVAKKEGIIPSSGKVEDRVSHEHFPAA